MTESSAFALNKIVEYLTKGLVFILPLFFLPWTFDFFDYNKQLLLWLAVPLLAVLWLVGLKRRGGEIVIERTPLDIPILTFLLITFLSGIFGLDRFSSFFGYYGNFTSAWFGFLALGALYFLIVNIAGQSKNFSLLNFLMIIFWAYCLVLAGALFSFFGFWDKFFGADNIFYSPTFNLAGGSLENFTGYSLVVAIMSGALLIFYGDYLEGKKQVWFSRLVFFSSFIFLILVDAPFVWWGALVFGFLFIGILLGKQGMKEIFWRKLIFPCLVVFFALIFLFFPLGKTIYLSLGQTLPKELKLGYKTTALVSFSTLKDKLTLGAGPGSFAYNFSLYRPIELNQGEFWQFRFDRGGSYFLELIGTIGALGILSYLLVWLVIFYLVSAFIFKIYLSKKLINSQTEEKNQILALVLAFGLMALIFLQIFSTLNTTLLFLFWVLLGLLLGSLREIAGFNFGVIKINHNGKFLNIIIFSLASFWVILLSFSGKYWLADYYAQAGGADNLIRAIKLNPNRTEYQISLAKNYLNSINREMLKPAEERKPGLIEGYLDKSVKIAKLAVGARSYYVVNQEALAMVYRDIKYLTRGSEMWAIKAFEEAIRLEPTNPVLLTELGKSYLDAGFYNQAEEAFLEAKRLKGNYYEADLGISLVKIKNNETEEALEILNNLAVNYSDERILFERGRLYYNKGETEKAKENFLAILNFNPNHANALYSLGLVFELEGNEREALKYLKKVLELNPSSEEVKNKINSFDN